MQIRAPVAQWSRASRLHREGRAFNPRQEYFVSFIDTSTLLLWKKSANYFLLASYTHMRLLTIYPVDISCVDVRH